MTDVERELAVKLAGHPKWKWMIGILADDGNRVLAIGDGGRVLISEISGMAHVWQEPSEMPAPFLSDPATHGCLIEMLDAAALPDRIDAIAPVAGGWRVDTMREGRILPKHHHGSTRGEALARALLSVWSEPETA